MQKKILETGRIVNTHGVRGEVRVEVWADSPESLLDVRVFYIDGQPRNVLESRAHKGMLLVRFEGIDDVSEAQKYKGRTLSADREAIRTEEGRYFVEDLIGLQVICMDGKRFGSVFDVLSMPAHDVYVVRSDDGEHMIPAVGQFVKEIDVENGFIRVELIEGM